MTVRSKFSAILLLGVTLVPLLFMAVSLLHQQWNRWEMTEKMEHAQLIELAIQDTAVHWVKPGKELLVNGKLFDVKTVAHQNGVTHFTGLYDHEETAIIAHIRNQMHKEQGTQRVQATLFCYLLLGGDPTQLQHDFICYQEITSRPQILDEGFLIPPALARMTPPPQC